MSVQREEWELESYEKGINVRYICNLFCRRFSSPEDDLKDAYPNEALQIYHLRPNAEVAVQTSPRFSEECQASVPPSYDSFDASRSFSHTHGIHKARVPRLNLFEVLPSVAEEALKAPRDARERHTSEFSGESDESEVEEGPQKVGDGSYHRGAFIPTLSLPCVAADPPLIHAPRSGKVLSASLTDRSSGSSESMEEESWDQFRQGGRAPRITKISPRAALSSLRRPVQGSLSSSSIFSVPSTGLPSMSTEHREDEAMPSASTIAALDCGSSPREEGSRGPSSANIEEEWLEQHHGNPCSSLVQALPSPGRRFQIFTPRE